MTIDVLAPCFAMASSDQGQYTLDSLWLSIPVEATTNIIDRPRGWDMWWQFFGQSLTRVQPFVVDVLYWIYVILYCSTMIAILFSDARIFRRESVHWHMALQCEGDFEINSRYLATKWSSTWRINSPSMALLPSRIICIQSIIVAVFMGIITLHYHKSAEPLTKDGLSNHYKWLHVGLYVNNRC